jgi:hypothetical protein
MIVNNEDTITFNNSVNYPMLSVYKVHEAVAVANYMRLNGIPLHHHIKLSSSQLRADTYSPLQKKYPSGVSLAISRLIEYSLQCSDNNACDALFDFVGGSCYVESYIKSLGINDCSIKYTEYEMRQDLDRIYDNWTTPLAAAKIMDFIFCDNVFPDDVYTKFIRKTLGRCLTGEKRMPRFLPKNEIFIAHKTGSGPRNANGAIIGTNDIGYVRMKNGAHYSLSVLIKDSYESNELNERIIADISKIVYHYLSNSYDYK